MAGPFRPSALAPLPAPPHCSLSHRPRGLHTRPHARRIWDQYDVSGTGVLDGDEALQFVGDLLRCAGHVSSKASVVRLCRALDKERPAGGGGTQRGGVVHLKWDEVVVQRRVEPGPCAARNSRLLPISTD